MKDDDILYVLPSIAMSLVTTATKMVNTPLIESRDTIIKSYHEGLIHITSEDTCDAIMQSQEMYASSRFASYGIHKRCFFFAGIPDFVNVCLNCHPEQKLTAIRLKLPYEKLAEFDYRSANDGAISYKGNLDLRDAVVEKVYLGLKEKEGELYYDEISAQEYANYQLNLSPSKTKVVSNKLAFKVRGLMAGLRKDLELVMNSLKDESSGFRLLKRDYASENADLFEKTEEIPVAEILSARKSATVLDTMRSYIVTDNNQINEMSSAIKLFSALNNPNEQVSKEDVKGELLKSFVINRYRDINNGKRFEFATDSNITPEMNEEDMSSVLFTNLVNGDISKCYELLNYPTVLFAACKSFAKSQTAYGYQEDVRVSHLTSQIDEYNKNNLKPTQVEY